MLSAVSWIRCTASCNTVDGIAEPRVAQQLHAALQCVFHGAQGLAYGIVQLEGDALALALLRTDQLLGQRHQLIARAAQRDLGLFAADNFVTQVAVGVGKRLGAGAHPILEAGIEPLEFIARPVESALVGDHQYGACIAALRLRARSPAHRPDGQVNKTRTDRNLQLEKLALAAADLAQRLLEESG